MRLLKIFVAVLLLSMPAWAAFGHTQGLATAQASGTTALVTLTNNPATGDPVAVAVACTSAPTGMGVSDGNSNNYTLRASIAAGTRTIWIGYLIAPSNANKAITASWTGTAFCVLWVDDFTTSATAYFDTPAAITATGTATAGAIVTPVVTPTNSAELVYSVAGYSVAGTPTPIAGGTQGSWTGSGGGPKSGVGNAEYDLSVSVGTAVNYTAGTTTAYGAMAIAFTTTAPSVNGHCAACDISELESLQLP